MENDDQSSGLSSQEYAASIERNRLLATDQFHSPANAPNSGENRIDPDLELAVRTQWGV